jgi:aspartate/methionine/tyrosine aminotransferase
LNAPDNPRRIASARARVQALTESKIRQVANAALGEADVLAFWFGEPDQVTPDFVREAAIRALQDGDTFYTHNLGMPALREAIAAYLSRLHRPIDAARIAVTSSGVNALMLVHQALLDPGDRVAIVTPVWPNVVEGPKILGANVVRVPLVFDGAWRLDLQRLLDALTQCTRAIIINSPNNPTGWSIDRSSQQAILEHCRRLGIWIVADDVYERLHYGDDAACAPSFLDIADEDDLLVSTNSFSKAWLMTGWRLGWIAAPRPLMQSLPKLIEYNTSCAPGFVQRAALAAIESGDHVIAQTRARARSARDFLHRRLQVIPGVIASLPQGAMYIFLRVEGARDSVALAKDLVVHARLGLAPGAAFGAEGEGWLRWCFASETTRLEEGVARFERGLETRRP